LKNTFVNKVGCLPEYHNRTINVNGAQMDGNKVKRVALESELEDLALEIVSDH
jgi:hypothetical protein